MLVTVIKRTVNFNRDSFYLFIYVSSHLFHGIPESGDCRWFLSLRWSYLSAEKTISNCCSDARGAMSDKTDPSDPVVLGAANKFTSGTSQAVYMQNYRSYI